MDVGCVVGRVTMSGCAVRALKDHGNHGDSFVVFVVGVFRMVRKYVANAECMVSERIIRCGVSSA